MNYSADLTQRISAHNSDVKRRCSRSASQITALECCRTQAPEGSQQEELSGACGRHGRGGEAPSILDEPRARVRKHEDAWYDQAVSNIPARWTNCSKLIGGMPEEWQGFRLLMSTIDHSPSNLWARYVTDMLNMLNMVSLLTMVSGTAPRVICGENAHSRMDHSGLL
jgi:hypothetical protein